MEEMTAADITGINANRANTYRRLGTVILLGDASYGAGERLTIGSH
jgi:hypothetical protein